MIEAKPLTTKPKKSSAWLIAGSHQTTESIEPMPRNTTIKKLLVFTAVVISWSFQAVSAAPPESPPSFRRDVMPVFFRAGCNAGTCHGSSRGKDGFMLSLFGYDAKGDYFRLTEELIGRRINVAAPSESLLLKKASGQVPHTGGKRFSKDSPYYETLLKWIEAGAPNDPDDAAPGKAIDAAQTATARTPTSVRLA